MILLYSRRVMEQEKSTFPNEEEKEINSPNARTVAFTNMGFSVY